MLIISLVLKGAVKVGSDENTLPHEKFHTLVLSANKNETGVQLTATEENTELILVSPESPTECIFSDCTLTIGRRGASGTNCVPVWSFRDDDERGSAGYTQGL